MEKDEKGNYILMKLCPKCSGIAHWDGYFQRYICRHCEG